MDRMFLKNLKICGITSRETARFCAEAGAGALGAVFFKKSPRYVTPQQTRLFFEDLPAEVARVGVFVDMPSAELIRTAHEASLDTVQLHGNESSADVAAAQQAGFHVIKVLKVTGEKLWEAAQALPATVGILIECGQGILPGGNGAAWNWAAAAPLATVRPFALAGGLTPDNLLEASRLSRAVAWDISSGVETAPGIKDPAAVLRLLQTAQTLAVKRTTAFWKGPHE
jgi:phosphoribosylanthranilate isomerase